MTHNGNEEETEMKNFEDEDNMGEKYDLEEVRLMIQEQVREHYANLEDTIRTFFPSNKVTILNSADLKIIESFFVYELMDCAKEEAAEFFTEKIKKKNDYMNNFVILSYELSTFEDIRRCDLVPSDGKGYCKSLCVQYSHLVDDYEERQFVAEFKATFWGLLMLYNNNDAEMNVLHSLIACFHTGYTLPKLLIDQFELFSRAYSPSEKLQEPYNTQNFEYRNKKGVFLKKSVESIKFKIEMTKEIQKLYSALENFDSDGLTFEKQFVSAITGYLRPTLIEVKSSENRCILEVIGGLISMKKITEDFEKNKKIYNIEEVRIIAAYMLQIDCNLDNSIWHGINVVIKATNVEIMGVYTWDLSGISSNERYKKAKGGQEHGDAGEDGVDGPAGESAGNLLMLADRVTNAEKLMVLLNGGNASSGQDGGDGVDGQDGTGLCKDVLLKDYPPTAKLEQGVKSNEDRIILVQNTIINFGKVGTKWIKWNSTGEKFDNYLEVEMADQKITFSGGWYWVYQAFFLHEGSEGKPGGLGGQQGLGGDAGFKGDCLAVCPKNNRSISINAKRKGGEKGADGKPGRNGEWGKNGWDTGWIDHQFWTNPVYYGDNKNMKLKLCYSRNSSSDKVYCPYRYEELGLSDYYVELLELKLEHKYLNDHEKVPEHVDRRKQKAAIATRKNTISKKKIEQNYSKFFESDTALSQEIDKTQAEEKNGYSALQNKANEVFEEVEKAKERSREKVSRFQEYRAGMQNKKQIVAERVKCNPKMKRQILEDLKSHPSNSEAWQELFHIELATQELSEFEILFKSYYKNRKLASNEHLLFYQKMGLAYLRELNKMELKSLDIISCDNDPETILNEMGVDISGFLALCDDNTCTSMFIEAVENSDREDQVTNMIHELKKNLVNTETLERIRCFVANVQKVKPPSATFDDMIEDPNFGYISEDNKRLSESPAIQKLLEELKQLREGKSGVISIEKTMLKMDSSLEVMKKLIPSYDDCNLNENVTLLRYLAEVYIKLKWCMEENKVMGSLVEAFVLQVMEDKKWTKKERLQQCIEEYNESMNKNDEEFNWHHYANDEELQEYCKIHMIAKGKLSSAYREIIAWKYAVNIKAYAFNKVEELIQIGEHFPEGTTTEYVLLSEKDACKQLAIKKSLVELVHSRERFLKNCLEVVSKTNYPITLRLQNNIVIDWKLPIIALDSKLSDEEEQQVINKLCSFFPETAQGHVTERLSKLTSQFLGQNSILLALYMCFQCNGCHLTVNEVEFLVNIILEFKITYDQHVDFFTGLICSFSQETLLDQLILIKVENVLGKQLQQKQELEIKLPKIIDIELKLLLGYKLDECTISEQDMSQLITFLKYNSEQFFALEKLNLRDWVFTLKEGYWQQNISTMHADLRKHDKHFVLYLTKLEKLYGETLVKRLLEVLKTNVVLSGNFVLKFMYRLYSEELILSDKVLQQFRELHGELRPFRQISSLHSQTRSQIEDKIVAMENKSLMKADKAQHILSLMSALGSVQSGTRNYSTLLRMIKSQNSQQDAIDFWNSVLFEIREARRCMRCWKIPFVKYVQNATLKANSLSADNLSANVRLWLPYVRSYIKANDNLIKTVEHTVIKKDAVNAFLLQLIDDVIFSERKFRLRDSQKLVVMIALKNDKSLLGQVSTGEGKTLIITTLSIIKAIWGEKMDIVTSSSILAKRDAESPPPKGNSDIYKLFGVSVGHICDEDIEKRKLVYSNCQVVYGDLSSFQRDYLLDRFYGKNIFGGRNFQNVIVDEVDCMLLDNGNNMLYLSHDIPSMDRLQSLYVYIWQVVNQPLTTEIELQSFFNTTAIQHKVLSDLYGMVTHEDVRSVKDDSDEVFVEKTLQKLKEFDIVGADGRLLSSDITDYREQISAMNIEQNTEDKLVFLLNSIASRQRSVHVPSHLHKFMERHLLQFIENAKMALFMNEGVDYVVDVDRTNQDPDMNPKIIILDKDTGTDQSSSQWNEGLHQFLQLKHGCKLTLMSLKAVFISNVSYLRLYENLYGLTGTLGSQQEKELLCELYDVNLVKFPTAKPKNFFEEHPIICASKKHWIDSIAAEVKKKVAEGRCLLIICESVKDVEYIHKHLVQQVTADVIIHTYKRDHEEFSFGQGNETLSSGHVIVATNLAGRGTDIKLDKKVINNGGLHVIVTFLPRNGRVEEQAYGRAARCGEDGSGQLIITTTGQEQDCNFISKIFELKNVRDSEEYLRLQMIKKNYDDQVTIEEKCFKKFQKTYEKLKKDIEKVHEKLKKESENDTDMRPVAKILLDSFLDKWAFWLDEHAHLIKKCGVPKTASTTEHNLFASLENFLNQVSVKYDSWLDSPHQYLKLAIHYIKEKQYDKATEHFDKIIATYKDSSTEALYYKSSVIIKTQYSALENKNSKEYKILKSSLLKAKRDFEERISQFTNDQAIIQTFKKQGTNNVIHINAFSEQQDVLCRIYSLFINSIDDIFGHHMTANVFIDYDINEILAYDIFQKLQSHGLIEKPKLAEIDEKEVKRIARDYGIPSDFLNALSLNQDDLYKSVLQNVDMPSLEKFWKILTTSLLLINEEELIMVEGSRLGLIDKEISDTLEECTPLSLDASKLARTEILQYPSGHVSDATKVYNRNQLLSKLDTEKIEYLIERGVFKTNRRGTINFKNAQEVQNFPKYDEVTAQDLRCADISESEINTIFNILVKQKILKETSSGSGNYHLMTATIDCNCLPFCYRDTVAAVLQRAFAYQLAYRDLQDQLNAAREQEIDRPLRIKLTPNPHQRLFYDLIESGIIKPARVSMKKVKGANLETIFIPSEAENFNTRRLHRHRLESGKIWRIELEHTDHNSKRDIVTETLFRNEEILKKKIEKDVIKSILIQQGCGLANLETIDCHYSTIEEALKTLQIAAVVEAAWFSLNGMEQLIVLKEQMYSKRMWIKTGAIAVFAITQIFAGAVLEIYTVGAGTYGASFLINEGISDLFFVANCMYSGQCQNYWQHKIMSAIMNAASGGIAACWSRGTKLSQIGYKVAGPVRKEGAKAVSQMAGKKLIKEVGKQLGKEGSKVVRNLTLQRIGIKIAEGVAFGAAQSGVEYVVHNHLSGLCAAIRSTVTSDMDRLFREHDLSTNLLEAYKIMGERKAGQLVQKLTQEYFDFAPVWKTVLSMCSQALGVFMRAAGEVMQKTSKASTTVAFIATICTSLPMVMQIQRLTSLISELANVEISVRQFLNNANECVNKELEKAKQENENVGCPHPDVLRNQAMDKWKGTVVVNANQIIANNLVSPLLNMGATALLSAAGRYVKKCYNCHKEKGNWDQFERIKKEHHTSQQSVDSEVGASDKNYNAALLKLMRKTRDAKLFAAIISEGVPMDVTCVQACTSMMHSVLAKNSKDFKGVKIIVMEENGASHEYSSSSEASVTIYLNLEDNHFTISNPSTGGDTLNLSESNNCLYDAVVQSCPDLRKDFANGDVFRQGMAQLISADENMQYVIAQGWHDYAISKGSFGGELPKFKASKQIEKKNEELQNVNASIKSNAEQLLNKINIAVAENSNDTNIQSLKKSLDKFQSEDMLNDAYSMVELKMKIQSMQKELDKCGISTEDQRQFKDQLANSARLRKDLGLLQKAVETKEAERDAKFRRTPGKYTEKHIRRQGGKNLQMPSIPEDKVSDHITEYNANSNIEVTFETDAFNVDSSETSEEHYEHVERVANQSKFERKEHTTIMGNQDKLEDDAKKLSEHMGWNNDKKMHPIKFKRTDGKPVNARRTAIVEITNPDGTKHYQADRTRSERIEGEGVTAFMYGGSLRHDGGMNEERQRMSSQSSAQEPSRELKPPELPREQTKEKQPDKRDE